MRSVHEWHGDFDSVESSPNAGIIWGMDADAVVEGIDKDTMRFDSSVQ